MGKYVTPDVLESILREDGAKSSTFTAAPIEYVLVFVRGDTPDDISQRVGKVAEIAMSHDGTVHALIGALIIIAFDNLPAASLAAGKRIALVEHLSRELSSHLKIVHGAADGHYGNIGSKIRLTYSFLLPHFDAILGRLSSLEFGQIEEFKK
ncbi:MAG TPA: hypothetical protein VG347_08440 [Verrucomicrobiae bacterium]|nr:hypothetical protein [Verrucomicrobiae bacterium]